MATGDDTSRWRKIVLGDESLPDPDWPTDHVPSDARRSFVSVSAVLLGLVFFAGTIFAGADVGAVLGFGPMLVALAIGSVILGIYVSIARCTVSKSAQINPIAVTTIKNSQFD